MNSSINAFRPEVHGSLQHGNRAGAKGASNGGLLVRGGGAAVIAGGPLGVVLFATAFLSAVLERSTKAGAVVGAPLLSFATFCILRCHTKVVVALVVPICLFPPLFSKVLHH